MPLEIVTNGGGETALLVSASPHRSEQRILAVTTHYDLKLRTSTACTASTACNKAFALR